MPRRKRTLAECKNEEDNDSEYEEQIDSAPPRKKSRRVSDKQKQKEDEDKNKYDLDIFEYETIAVVAPKDDKSIKGSTKIAAFDMDWTMVRPKGKNKFPKGRNDWIWMYEDEEKNLVKNKLKQLHSNGYRIIIFTNQNGIGSGKQSLTSVAGKIIDLSEVLEVPLMGFLSIQKDHWRKPNITMWEYFEKYYNNDVKIDYKSSFYVGDAGGRPKAWRNKGTKKDFSCSDRKFAVNIGIDFHTPEPFFLGENECKNWKYLAIDVNEWIKLDKNKEDQIKDIKNWYHGTLPISRNKNKNEIDMVLMMGPPGCGKTNFAKNYLVKEGYEWINRDTLKTKKKCIDTARKLLKEKKCVVIDNTNPDSISREVYITMAKSLKMNIKIRLFRMTTERGMAEHLNLVRERSTKSQRKRIPRMVYNIFYKKLREGGEPHKNEGFDEIVNVDFIPQFKDDQHRKDFLQYT